MHYRRHIKKDYKFVADTSFSLAGRRRKNRRLPVVVLALACIGLGTGLYGNLADAARGRRPSPTAAVSAGIPLPLPPAATRPPVASPPPSAESSGPPEPGPVAMLETAPNEAGDASEPAEAALADLPAAAQAPAVPEPAAAPAGEQVTVRRGDTLLAIFGRIGLDRRDLYQMLADPGSKRRLSRLQPGQTLVFQRDAEDRLTALVWKRSETQTIRIVRSPHGFETQVVETALEPRITSARGTIDSSLFLAGQRVGLSDNLIMRMIDIFAWDVDFALDIRSGDSFDVLFEELYDAAGRKVGDGDILAAEFTNRGRVVRALRYTDPEGHTDYYSPRGLSMRKAFLRTPVRFSRISSRFSTGRYHPVLHRIRAHKGVDYAAPRGTPVKASGDGKVVHAGRKGGYGRTVMLRHGERYTTVYAHLSRYGRAIKKGARVRQGQVIGYVGSSGLATGPHLHYEFRVDGVHRDPLKVKLPKALPLKKAYREDFKTKTRGWLASLDRLDRTQVALNQD